MSFKLSPFPLPLPEAQGLFLWYWLWHLGETLEGKSHSILGVCSWVLWSFYFSELSALILKPFINHSQVFLPWHWFQQHFALLILCSSELCLPMCPLSSWGPRFALCPPFFYTSRKSCWVLSLFCCLLLSGWNGNVQPSDMENQKPEVSFSFL